MNDKKYIYISLYASLLLLTFHKLTILIWQFLGIEFHQLEGMSQTPLLCVMSADP